MAGIFLCFFLYGIFISVLGSQLVVFRGYTWLCVQGAPLAQCPGELVVLNYELRPAGFRALHVLSPEDSLWLQMVLSQGTMINVMNVCLLSMPGKLH